MLSVRLPIQLENKLDEIVHSTNTSKTEIIKIALQMYIDELQTKRSAYNLGKDLFGKYGSGNGNLSKDYKKIIKQRLHEKHSH